MSGKLGGLPTIPTKTPQATLEWSERQPNITVESVSDLDRALDTIERRCAA